MSLNVWKLAKQMRPAPGSLILNIRVFACFLQIVQVWTHPSVLTVSVAKKNVFHLNLFAGLLVQYLFIDLKIERD
jgi:hypothetical protein